MPYLGVITIDCECCQPKQEQRDRDGAIPKICDFCLPHRGKPPDKVLARAQSHEAMLRGRLNACRTSEARARHMAERAKEQVAAALTSRGSLAARIVAAASSTGSHRCAAQAIGRDPQVIQIAQRHASREYDPDADWLMQ